MGWVSLNNHKYTFFVSLPKTMWNKNHARCILFLWQFICRPLPRRVMKGWKGGAEKRKRSFQWWVGVFGHYLEWILVSGFESWWCKDRKTEHIGMCEALAKACVPWAKETKWATVSTSSFCLSAWWCWMPIEKEGEDNKQVVFQEPRGIRVPSHILPFHLQWSRQATYS